MVVSGAVVSHSGDSRLFTRVLLDDDVVRTFFGGVFFEIIQSVLSGRVYAEACASNGA